MAVGSLLDFQENGGSEETLETGVPKKIHGWRSSSSIFGCECAGAEEMNHLDSLLHFGRLLTLGGVNPYVPIKRTKKGAKTPWLLPHLHAWIPSG
jgi:hypothetical protein